MKKKKDNADNEDSQDNTPHYGRVYDPSLGRWRDMTEDDLLDADLVNKSFQDFSLMDYIKRLKDRSKKTKDKQGKPHSHGYTKEEMMKMEMNFSDEIEWLKKLKKAPIDEDEMIELMRKIHKNVKNVWDFLHLCQVNSKKRKKEDK